MKTKVFFLIIFSALLAIGCSHTQNPKINLNLDFEDIQEGKPQGWRFHPLKNYSVSLDSVTVKSGKYSVAIEFTGDSTYFQYVACTLPNNYIGKNITLSGYIKTENVDGFAGLFIQIDPGIGFDNMEKDSVAGTNDWQRYEVSLDMNPPETQQIIFGGMLTGKGKMWLDDLHITIDGKDIKDAKIFMESLSKKEITELRKYIYPLRTFEPDDGDTKDLNILDKLIGKSSVVALGENSHGSSEIYKMKNRIIQYLAENKDFNVFSIEANMPESYKLNNYTIRGEGDPKKLIAGMYFWTWNTEEVLNMVEWMHKFNQPKQRIEFTGFDMQFTGGSINELFDAFKGNKGVENKIEDLKKVLDKINIQAQKNDYFINTDSDEMKDTYSILSSLQHNIETSTFQTTKKGWLLQNIVIIRQYLTLHQLPKEDPKRYGIWRDKSMADNFMWIKEHNPDSKFVIWAHNAHIQKTDNAMGFHLAQKLGEDYTTFGFTFFDGSFTAAGNKGLTAYESGKAYPGTLEYLLNQLDEPIFILDLKKIKSDNNKDLEWLMKQLPHRSIGAVADPEYIDSDSRKIADDFDYLIFIKTSSPSHLLSLL
jgi:erythromycin esterase